MKINHEQIKEYDGTSTELYQIQPYGFWSEVITLKLSEGKESKTSWSSGGFESDIPNWLASENFAKALEWANKLSIAHNAKLRVNEQ